MNQKIHCKRHQSSLLTGPRKRAIKRIKINMTFSQHINIVKLQTRKLMYKKLIGVTIGRKLNFNEFVSNTVDKKSRKNSSTRKNFVITIRNAKIILNDYLPYVSFRVLSLSMNEPQQCRGGSRAAATSKMECFVVIINGFQPLTIITKGLLYILEVT